MPRTRRLRQTAGLPQPLARPTIARMFIDRLSLGRLSLGRLFVAASLASLAAPALAEAPPSVRVLATTPAEHESPAAAAQEAPAEADLQALVAQLERSSGAASLSPERGQVTVRAGETLAQVARRALPNTPLKDDIVRQAFERLNPDAAGSGRYRPLRAGTRLSIPAPGDLRQAAVARHPEAAGLFLASPPKPAVREAAEPTPPPPGKDQPRWIRFPG